MTGFEHSPRSLDPRLRQALRRTRAAIWAERLARALWPGFSVVCLAAGVGILGGFEALGPAGVSTTVRACR